MRLLILLYVKAGKAINRKLKKTALIWKSRSNLQKKRFEGWTGGNS